MALPNELHPLQLGAGSVSSYQIEQSLRFNSGDNTVITRNVTSSGNRTTWTFSGWFKRTKFGEEHNLWSAAPGAHASNPNITYLDFNDVDKLMAYSYHDGAEKFRLKSTAVFRDPSAWYHIVWRHDTTLSTADDRVRLYVNGVQLTEFDERNNPTQSYESKMNDTIDHTLGEEATRDRYNYNGYMSDVYFIDGQSLGPDTFGEYDTSGVWRPIEYTGTYGTNGFYLKFDPTATNGIGHDHSGNDNNFTPTGLVTTGAGTDVMDDTPTKNWCTLNPVGSTAASQCSNGNLEYYNGTTSSWRSGVSSFAVSSGKWYFEARFTNFPASSGAFVGVGRDTIQWVNNLSHFGQSSVPGSYGYYSGNGNIYDGSAAPTYGSTYSTNDLIGCALDLDAGTLHFYKNGVDQGEAASGLTGTWNFGVSSLDSPAVVNFGQREFLYPPGTASATSYFNTVLYTGNNSTNAITGVGFAPDFVWIKPRNLVDNHRLNDIIRGPNRTLSSNSTTSE